MGYHPGEMRRLTLLFVAAGAAGCAATGLPDRPVFKDYELKQTDFSRSLKSGLRVVLQEDHSAPMVTVVSVFNVASTSDPEGVEGLAHLVEHLAFRSTPGGVQVWDHLKRMGAAFNATTEYDFTTYYETAHKDNLPMMMQLAAWRLARTLEGVTPEVFATEREVVRQELRQREETSIGGRIFDTLAAQLFPKGHPLARPVGGTHESLSAATLEHARKFVADHYRPDNCTIVISGAVKPAEVAELLGRWPAEILFGPGGPDGPAVPPRNRIVDRKPLPVPAPARTELTRHRGPIEQPLLLLGWSGPPGRRGQDAGLQFLAARLNLALDQGLEFREDDEIESVSAGAHAVADGSVFVVEARLRPGADPERARRRVLDVLVHTWTTELGRLLTEAVRWSAATSLLLLTSDPVASAMGLAQHMAAMGSLRFFTDSFEALARVRAAEAMELAYKYITRERAVAVYFEPENDEVPRLVGGGGGPAAGRRAEHEIGRDATAATTELGPERILQVARAPGLASVPRFKLHNGLEVVVVKHGTAPVAQVRVGLRGGDAMTRPFGLASWAARFTGTRCRDHGDLLPVGGRMFDTTGLTGSTYLVDVASGNLSNAVAVLSDALACREVSEEAFVVNKDRSLERRRKAHERLSRLPTFLATKTLWAELYPGHPFGVAAVDPGTLEPVTYADAAGWARAHYRPDNAVAVVVGDVDPAETRALATKYLGRWSAGGGATGAIPPAPPPPAARKAFLVDRPQATQAVVRIGCRLADATPERLPAYDLVGAIANERTWLLREEWGATYGVFGAASSHPGGAAHFVVGGAIETPQAARAVTRLLDLVDELVSERLDENLFLVKRWDVARGFNNGFATGEDLAGAVLRAAVHGWPHDVWDRYPERLAATTRATIREVMKPCPGREIVTIVGDAATLRPQLEQAGLRLEASP